MEPSGRFPRRSRRDASVTRDRVHCGLCHAVLSVGCYRSGMQSKCCFIPGNLMHISALFEQTEDTLSRRRAVDSAPTLALDMDGCAASRAHVALSLQSSTKCCSRHGSSQLSSRAMSRLAACKTCGTVDHSRDAILLFTMTTPEARRCLPE